MAQKRKNNKKWIYWVVLLALLVLAAVVTFLVWNNYFNDKKENTQEVKQTEKVEKVEDAAKSMQDEEKDEAEKAVEQKKIEQYDGDDPNTAEELSGVVTYAGVVDGKVMIRVNIDQFLNSGECGLTLIRGDATIYNSIANITGSASTATCEGFDIPVDDLGGGVAEIIIKLSADGKMGTIRGEVSI